MRNFLQCEHDSGVLTLTMNRPEERNALSTDAIFDEFDEVCRSVAEDLSVRAVILTGAGPVFCAGGNVKQMYNKEGIAAGTSAEIRSTYKRGLLRLPKALWDLEVPVIAAVNGPAIGAGCDLALMCDIRIAAENAQFAASFTKLGIVPADGGAWLLPRLIGPSKAAELIFTGDAITAQEALDIGLVSEVVSGDRLLLEARSLAGRIAKNPPHAVRLSKRLLREAASSTFSAALEMSAALQSIAHHTHDHGEAVAAFVEKRKPSFEGR